MARARQGRQGEQLNSQTLFISKVLNALNRVWRHCQIPFSHDGSIDEFILFDPQDHEEMPTNFGRDAMLTTL